MGLRITNGVETEIVLCVFFGSHVSVFNLEGTMSHPTHLGGGGEFN